MVNFIAAVSFVVIVLVTIWVVRVHFGRARQLENFAEEVGLAYDDSSGPYGTVYGKVHEFDYEVTIQLAAHYNQFEVTVGEYVLVCRADLRRLLPRDLSISPQRFLDDVAGDAVGQTDVEIGDDDFDPEFVVDADDPDRAAELLQRGRAADALTGLASSDDSYVHIHDGRLELLVGPIPTSADDIRRWSDRFARYVDRFSDALQQPPEEDVGPQGW